MRKYHQLPVPFCGVYILYLGNIPQYVGRTVNFYKRMAEHVAGVNNNGKSFKYDRVVFREVPKEELDMEEQRLIVRLQPLHNKMCNYGEQPFVDLEALGL